MKNERNSEKNQLENQLGIFEETAPLRKVIMWGQPGVEAVLAQLLPKRISCFESEFNVPEARNEFINAESLLKQEGAEIILVKDLMVEMIKAENLAPRTNLETLKKELKDRGHQFYEKYKDEDISKISVLDWIDPILEDEVKKYGETATIVMNDTLSLQSKLGLPLANVLYARDQSNLLGKVWVWSNMVHDIRKEEVGLYKEVLDWAGIIKPSEITEIQISDKGKFEGGDGIVHDGICYIGVGGRTNLRGISQIAPAILAQGTRLMVVYDGKRTRKEEPEMDAMHLDTFWMPCGKNKVVACEAEMSRRRLIEISFDRDGKLNIDRKGNFLDYMKSTGMEIVPLTKYEQLHYAPNFVNINDNKVILSLSDKNGLTEELGTAGMECPCANLTEITKGYGGLHCMTSVIKRG